MPIDLCPKYGLDVTIIYTFKVKCNSYDRDKSKRLANLHLNLEDSKNYCF